MSYDLNLCKSALAGVGVLNFCAEFSSHNRETPPSVFLIHMGRGVYF